MPHAADPLHAIRPTGGDRLGATHRVDLRRAKGTPASRWSTFDVEIHGDALPRGYAGDEPVPAASVVAHNALIASAAAAVLVRLMADPSVEAGDRVFWVYDGLRGAVRSVAPCAPWRRAPRGASRRAGLRRLC